MKPDYKNALLHKINFDYLFGQTCHACTRFLVLLPKMRVRSLFLHPVSVAINSLAPSNYYHHGRSIIRRGESSYRLVVEFFFASTVMAVALDSDT